MFLRVCSAINMYILGWLLFLSGLFVLGFYSGLTTQRSASHRQANREASRQRRQPAQNKLKLETIAWRDKQREILRDALDTDNVASLIAWEEHDVPDVSGFQAKKVTAQAYALTVFFTLLNQRDRQLLANPQHEQQKENMQEAGLFICKVAECAEQAGSGLVFPVSGRTVREWFSQWQRNEKARGVGSFDPDSTGRFKRSRCTEAVCGKGAEG